MKRRYGFTLIELLVVIAIIAILAAILFPVFSRAKESAKKAQAMAQMKQLAMAAMLYLGDYDDVYLPSTNYDAPLSDPNRVWTVPLFTYVKNRQIFVAPGSSTSRYTEGWETRYHQSVGYSDATAFGSLVGLPPEKLCTSFELKLGCSAFYSAANASIMEFPAETGLYATTPDGVQGSKYRGHVISADNGTTYRPDFVTFDDLDMAVPLCSDRDLVAELNGLTAAQLKPIWARYGTTGNDDGTTPVIFADGHAKSYPAKAIANGASGIVWRFR